MRLTLEERFWAKVRKSEGCWEWQGALTDKGYGTLCMDGRTRYAHRISYFLASGVWPTLCILHSCDNPKCVNPTHLREGTHAENMREAAQKGRVYRRAFLDEHGAPIGIGERHSQAKLTEDDVREIRQRWASGEAQPSIAKAYNIIQQTVSVIVRRRTWRHI